MKQLLIENVISSLIALSPDAFNFEIALSILDILILECDHYLSVEDMMQALVSARNVLANHIDSEQQGD
jgi:glutamate racemase